MAMYCLNSVMVVIRGIKSIRLSVVDNLAPSESPLREAVSLFVSYSWVSWLRFVVVTFVGRGILFVLLCKTALALIGALQYYIAISEVQIFRPFVSPLDDLERFERSLPRLG